ncbi:MAG: 1-acyl-sn-glycerol-3-phosphate acyltransferase [Planctomycetes bacterium]|nr:1-acyl-sn-glycerol-3-phosphate acyltransferase [Planctomycetota bacterium]
MQPIIIEKPYRFQPPMRSTRWSRLCKKLNLHRLYLRRYEGIVDFEMRGAERLRASLAEGHGIILVPNHSRNADPIVIGDLARTVRCDLFFMASWHLYHQSAFLRWAIHRLGAFSVNRETADRQAVDFATEVVANAERPLVIFPEGAMTRTNDHLHALLEGIEVIARVAARRRQKVHPGGKVVVHPVAIKYRFGGDVAAAVDPVLTKIEARFAWPAQRHLPLVERITRCADAVLCLREIQYAGKPGTGTVGERQQALIERLLGPLEVEWLGAAGSGAVVPRVKELRLKIVPDLAEGRADPKERARRWRHLADIYLAQQISCYPESYLESLPSIDRAIETVERIEDDLTDHTRVHRPWTAVVQVGNPIAVATDRGAPGTTLLSQVEQALRGTMAELAAESPLCRPGPAPP